MPSKGAPAETVSVGNCQSIKVQTKRSRADEAMALLKRIATLVAPIMRKHKWTLPLLCEFFPKSPNLLGMNEGSGSRIFIRLRPHHSPDTFYDLESSLIGTMLHELTHNVHGPHDQKFYSLLDKLQDDYDDLRRGGYTGEGFFSQGRRVGQGVAISDISLPISEARSRALAQAEKRAKLNAIMGPSGGQRLGGNKLDRHRTPREMMAAAAERRLRDEKACKHGDEVDVAAEAAKATEDAAPIMIDSDSEGDLAILRSASASDLPAPTAKKSKIIDLDSEAGTGTPAPRRQTDHAPLGEGQSIRRSTSRAVATPSESHGWICPACTYDNVNTLALQCEMCETLRPSEDAEGWRCLMCSAKNEHAFWMCRQCQTVKSSSSTAADSLVMRSSAVLH